MRNQPFTLDLPESPSTASSVLDAFRHSALAPTLFSCILVFLAGCTDRKSEQFRQRGDALLRWGNVQDAAGAYRRAQEMDPDNPLAHLGAGRCYLAENNQKEAMRAFQTAITIDPAAGDAYLEVVRLLVLQKKNAEALALAERLRAIAPETGGLLYAFVCRKTGYPDRAIEALSALLASAPENYRIQRELAAARISVGEAAEAETLLRIARDRGQTETDNVRLHLLLVEACRVQGKGAQIAQEYERIAADRPRDVAVGLALTQALLSAERVAEAEKVARALHTRLPDFAWSNHGLGACLLAQNKHAEALPYLERAAALLPLQEQVTRHLALARGSGDFSADASDTTVPKASPNRPRAPVSGELPRGWKELWKQAALRPLLARKDDFLAEQGAKAAETLAVAAFCLKDNALLQELMPKLPGESPLHDFFALMKQPDAVAFAEYMQAWKETEEDRMVLRANALGVGLARLGARLQAVAVLSESIAQAPSHGATYYNLAQILRATGRPEVASHVLTRLLSIASNNLEAHQLLYTVLRESGSGKEAQRAAEITYRRFSKRKEASLSLAQAYLDNHNLVSAERVLRRAAEKHTNSPAVQLALARILFHAGKAEEALQVTIRIPETAQTSMDIKTLVAFSAAEQDQWARVVEETEGIEEVSGTLPLRMLRAAALLCLGKSEEAGQSYAAGAKGTTQDRVILAALSGDTLSDPEESTLLQKLKNSPEALQSYLQARACLAVSSHRPALRHLRAAKKRVGDDPLLEAAILQCVPQSLSQDEQRKVASQISQDHPESAVVALGLAKVYASLNALEQQGQALERASQLAPQRPEAWRGKAFFLEKQGDLTAAVTAYARLVELLPNDFAGNNNLAYNLLLSEGDLDLALACAQKAVAMQPKSASALHTLGLIQMRQNNIEESAKNLRMAVALSPANPTLLLDYGQLLIQQNRQEDGLQHVRVALRYSEQFGVEFLRRDEAERLIRQHGAAEDAAAASET
jgi:cellulose synthase operon protein C